MRRSIGLFVILLIVAPSLWSAQDLSSPNLPTPVEVIQGDTTTGTIRVLEMVRAGSPMTFSLAGPKVDEQDEVNPFRDYRLNLILTQGDRTITVPGFFAADDDAAQSGATGGNRWRVIFVPPSPGEWSATVSFLKGKDIALSDDPAAGEPVGGDGNRATLKVLENPDAPGLLQKGTGRYLQWSLSKKPWLKAGVDSPENLLAYVDFDHTAPNQSNKPPQNSKTQTNAPRHSYQPHVADWKQGDPTWRDGKGKGLIGALNYLATVGVNSIYFIPMNIAGDGKDVWPYVDAETLDRFDVSKLAQWDIAFRHADSLGINLHVILTETENESLFETVEGGGDFADLRKLYYREMIARFGYHRAVEWNLGEENGGREKKARDGVSPGKSNTTAQRQAFAAYIRRLDAHGHPIKVHTYPGQQKDIYPPLLGDANFDGASLQVGQPQEVHRATLEWVRQSQEAGRPWYVCLDEIGPADTGLVPDADDPTHDVARHQILWGNLMAGGSGCEWYFGYKFAHNDLNLEDFRSRDAMFRQTKIAVDFFHDHLPFTEMRPMDDVIDADGAYCLAKPDDVYAIYLPAGTERPRLDLPEASYTVQWFNPREGGDLHQAESRSLNDLTPPNGDTANDWVLLLRVGE